MTTRLPEKKERPDFVRSNMKLLVGFAAGLAFATLGVIVWKTLFKKGTVMGTVRNAGGQPVEGVTVTLTGYHGAVHTAVTGADGTFRMQEVADVSYSYQGYLYYYFYNLEFTHPDYRPELRTHLVIHPTGNTFDIVMEALYLGRVD